MAQAPNKVFMPAAGEPLNCDFSLYISFRPRGQDAASISAAVINTDRCVQGEEIQERASLTT